MRQLALDFNTPREFDIKVSASVTRDGNIRIQTEYLNIVASQIVLMQDNAVRESLISLGWTPPPQPTGEQK
jgi:hypothetical protein